MENDRLLIKYLNEDCELGLPADNSFNQVKAALFHRVNLMIDEDPECLIRWLYHLDVDEQKVKLALKQNAGIPSASIITELIIERQLQKIKTRTEFKSPGPELSGEELW